MMKCNSPLQRSKPTKGKKPRKTSLAKAKTEADKWCFAYFRGLPCFVCGTTRNTCGHHLIPKSRSSRHRHSFENIIPLCPKHHTMGSNLCAHNQSSLAVGRFLDFLIEHDPARHAWMVEHEHDLCHYKTADWKDIAQYWRDVTEKRRTYEWMIRKCGLDPNATEDTAMNEYGT